MSSIYDTVLEHLWKDTSFNNDYHAKYYVEGVGATKWGNRSVSNSRINKAYDEMALLASEALK